MWEMFSKCDLRVGKIIECTPHPNSTSLYKNLIDLGEPTPRLIGSGLQQKIPVSELKSSLVVVFSNLKPRKLADFISNGMILAASHNDKIEVLRPAEGSQIGERVVLKEKSMG